MKRSDLIKKLLPGFIPLFVFIAADEIWGTKIGLIVAIIVGVVEFIYTYVMDKKFDQFILLDTGLLIVLGGVSIAFDNEIFFKLKPAIIEALMCVMLGVSAFTNFDIVGGMSQRYLNGIEMNSEVQQKFKQTLRTMFWIFIVHTIMVLISAFYFSKEIWAFVSGGLFYIIFAVYFAYEFWMQKRNSKKVIERYEDEEWVPVVEPDGKIVGKALRSQCHSGSMILHPVVHLHVMNNRNQLFLQKRPATKLIQPNKWDTAVGGHIAFGEEIQTSLKREAYEEIGLTEFSAKPIGHYVFQSEIERELVYSFLSYDYKGINLHSEEVQEGKFWTKNQIERNLGKGVFTPNFEMEYQHHLKEKLF